MIRLDKLFKRKPRLKREIFAHVGETVTCEKGHPICDVGTSIYIGDLPNAMHLVNWRQKQPDQGHQVVACEVCGCRRWHNYGGQHFHFEGGWRSRAPYSGVA